MSFITQTENPDLFENLKPAAYKKITKIGEVLEEQIELRKAAQADETESKDALKDISKQAYFEFNEDSDEPAHTFDFGGLQVNFVNSYQFKNDEQAYQLMQLLGENHPLSEELLATSELNIDITELEANGEFLAFAKELSALTKKYGVQAYTADKFSVTEDFHNKRHELLTVEDNLEVDKLLPVTVQYSLINS